MQIFMPQYICAETKIQIENLPRRWKFPLSSTLSAEHKKDPPSGELLSHLQNKIFVRNAAVFRRSARMGWFVSILRHNKFIIIETFV